MSDPVPKDVIPIEDGIKLGIRKAKLGRWQPRRWDNRYEMIVIMDMNGTARTEIARLFQMSTVQITNICNTDQAEIVRRRIYARLSEIELDKIPATLESITKKAIERVHDVLHNDDLARTSPLAVADRAISVLKGVGKLAEGGLGTGATGNINVKNAIFLHKSDIDDMRDALAKSDIAKALNLNAGSSEEK